MTESGITPRTPRVLVTGGAGFIGSALVRFLIRETDADVLNVDALTYAGDLDTVAEVATDESVNSRYAFLQADITGMDAIRRAFADFQPTAVMHLAAESHVDRSIDGPAAFLKTNIVGTFTMLESALSHWRDLPAAEADAFRFLHVSTDEVFGELGPTGHFDEQTPYRPRSPYSATKASSDHLVSAWFHTYGLPTLITNCSNNYGPFQNTEKLIPTIIRTAIFGQPIPVYGDGQAIRDYLFVDDHVRALWRCVRSGVPGETYVVGGHNERTTVETVRAVCALLDEFAPDPTIGDRSNLIRFVADRPGHDRRYAIDAGRIERTLGWRPDETFETGLRKTVRWYLDHPEWWGDAATPRLGLERTAEPAIASAGAQTGGSR